MCIVETMHEDTSVYLCNYIIYVEVKTVVNNIQQTIFRNSGGSYEKTWLIDKELQSDNRPYGCLPALHALPGNADQSFSLRYLGFTKLYYPGSSCTVLSTAGDASAD